MNPQQQRAFFEERGYLIVPGLLDNDEIAASRAEIKRLHRLATEIVFLFPLFFTRSWHLVNHR